jgi:hypothetical protein
MLWYQSSNVAILQCLDSPVVNFIKNFVTKAEQLLRRQFFMLLLATALGENAKQYVAWCKSCSLKQAQKLFSKNVRETEKPLFAIHFMLMPWQTV